MLHADLLARRGRRQLRCRHHLRWPGDGAL